MHPPHRLREIWLADDSPSELEHSRRLLARRYQVRTFTDGSELIEALSSGRLPAAILVDWEMESVSGIEVCRYVRSAPPPLCSLPVLLLTVHNADAQVVEGLEAGASDFVSKPFAEPVLMARVSALIRQRGLVERAERAEADVRHLLQSAPDALFVVNAEGRIVYANDEAHRVSGRMGDSLTGAAALDVFPGLSLRNISVGPGQSLLPLPDVTLRDRVYSPSIRLLPSDTAAATTISLRDVTEQRRTEERRLDFYSMIAHDLRTPLSAMLLRTEMILRGKHGILRPELAADVRKISQHARSLVAMINDFLELARLEGTGHKIDRAPVDVGGMVQRIGEDFQPLLETGRIHWKHEPPQTEQRVLGDAPRLTQVLTNLVGNAIKFTPQDGTITTRVLDLGGMVEVQVTDTGPGIEPALAHRLFSRYERSLHGGGSAGRSLAGTGLGLMIVREIVEAHGGEVGVQTELGRGSTFWFRLQKHDAGAPDQTGEPRQA